MCVCVNVWGGVHRQAGNAPRYHNSSPPTYITQPFSSFPDTVSLFSPWPYLHLSSPALLAVYFFPPSYLSIRRCSREHRQQTVTLAGGLLSLETPLFSFAPACSGFPVSERFDSYPAVFMSIAASHRGGGSHNHILCQMSQNNRWNTESRSAQRQKHAHMTAVPLVQTPTVPIFVI